MSERSHSLPAGLCPARFDGHEPRLKLSPNSLRRRITPKERRVAFAAKQAEQSSAEGVFVVIENLNPNEVNMSDDGVRCEIAAESRASNIATIIWRYFGLTARVLRRCDSEKKNEPRISYALVILTPQAKMHELLHYPVPFEPSTEVEFEENSTPRGENASEENSN